MSRKEDNSDLYIWVKNIKKVLSISFYINFILIVFNFAFAYSNIFIIISQILVSIISIIGNFINDYFIFPQAEQRNLERNMEDSFNISFGDDSLVGYYDNSIQPSIKKFIANSFENIFYTKKILAYSFPRMFISLVIYIIVFIVSISMILYLKLDNGLQIFSSLIQLLFSGQYILGTVKGILYKIKIDTLYKAFFTNYRDESPKDYALLGYAIEYEVLKSSLKSMLNSKVFEEKKSDIEKDWTEVKSLVFESKEQKNRWTNGKN